MAPAKTSKDMESNNRIEVKDFAYCSDKYQYTMGKSFYETGRKDVIAVFNMFYRKAPENNNWAVVSGIEEAIECIRNIGKAEPEFYEKFLPGDEYAEFRKYLSTLKFTGNVYAMREGEIAFPNQPIITVEAPLIEAQILETPLLCIMNHQMAVATKASRVCRATNRPVSEFGSRRAHGPWAATYGAKAAIIAGCASTSNILTGVLNGVPSTGTMAHSWVQMFPTEYDAFKKYAEMYPDACVLLVDTYNVLRHGVPDAIKVFDEVLKPMGKRPKGIRIDSGDIAYLSKKARKMLDEAGYPDCTICASNSLDEYIVRDLILQGARVDSFGIGENMITAKSDPVFGGVYKLAAVREDDGSYTPKMKLSESAEKMTIPCLKKVWRIYDQDGKAMADLITMADEVVETQHGITLFDPIETWKECTYVNCTARCLSTPIYENGKRVYSSPSLDDIKKFCKAQVNTLWDEVKRFENPHRYYVDLSQKLWDTRSALLKKLSK
mgnify:CR=1 FL=1